MRSLAFAHALLARWDRRVVSLRPLPLVLRQAAPPPAPRRGHERPAPLPPLLRQNVHVELRPQIALTLIRQLSTTTPPRPGYDQLTTSTHEHDTVERLVLRNTTALACERVIERALSRSRRVELLARPERARFAPAEEATPTTPPQMVLHSAPRPPSTEPDARRPDPEIRTTAERVSSPPQLDLAQLTDQVMSAIDGRLLSEAERLGRT